MKQFTDAKDDTWNLVINGGTIKRALDLLKVDLGDPLAGDPPLLTRFDTQIALKVDLLYVACMPEAQKREISDIEFAERLEGEALYGASEAFLEALVDFFQNLRRTHVVRAIRKQQDLVRRAVQMADELIGGEEFEAKIDAQLEELGRSFASSL